MSHGRENFLAYTKIENRTNNDDAAESISANNARKTRSAHTRLVTYLDAILN